MKEDIYDLKLLCVKRILSKHEIYYNYPNYPEDILGCLDNETELTFENIEAEVLNFINK